jgi:hypothetical protein
VIDVGGALLQQFENYLAPPKSILAVGYDRVFDLFADRHTLERAQGALAGGFSKTGREKLNLCVFRIS